jgi:prepilin-type N-terminal cleavage/methylation domain-containing protein
MKIIQYLNKKFNGWSGFSIIELIIALALMLMVLAVGYNFFFLNYRAYQTADTLAQVQFDTRMASDYITFELRNVYEISLTDNSMPDHIDLNQLSGQYPKVSAVSFTIGQSGSSYIISYTIIGSDPGLNSDYQLESEVLLNNVESASTGSGNTLYYEK